MTEGDMCRHASRVALQRSSDQIERFPRAIHVDQQGGPQHECLVIARVQQPYLPEEGLRFLETASPVQLHGGPQ
jgi:hypothetical protein